MTDKCKHDHPWVTCNECAPSPSLTSDPIVTANPTHYISYKDGTMSVMPIPQEQPTLRDRFAMAVLTGTSALPDVSDNLSTMDDVAADCYRMADAMLKARKK